jgi:hypothetical protein
MNMDFLDSINHGVSLIIVIFLIINHRITVMVIETENGVKRMVEQCCFGNS